MFFFQTCGRCFLQRCEWKSLPLVHSKRMLEGFWKDLFFGLGVLKMTVARVALKKRQDMQKWPCCILACQLLRAIWYKRTLQQWTRAFRNQQKAITDMFTIHRQCGSGVYYCYCNLFAGNQTDRGSCIFRISTNAANLCANPLNNKPQILRCKKNSHAWGVQESWLLYHLPISWMLPCALVVWGLWERC